MPGPILKLLRTALILVACTFAFAMLVFAPVELYAVHSVRQWQPVAAEFVETGFKRASFDDGDVYAYLTVRERATGREIEIRDVRPGDLPFEIGILGLHAVDTSASDMKAYTGRSAMTVWCAPNGRKCVLEQGHYGLMIGLLALSVLWWAGIAAIVRARSRPTAILRRAASN